MKELIKDLYRMVVELRKISQANNDLLGFICQQIAPNKKIIEKDISTEEMLAISMEMSELFDKYDVMPDEYGLS
jgi:hypothetical protein|tara:strand:- start:93 stop:314 length:222 start_codon:yes stop_codon:yes gene_type:complete